MIEVNLLPKEYRKRATPFHFDKKLMYAGGAVAVVFLLLVSFTIYKKHSINTLDKKIVSIERQRKALDKDIRLIDNLTDLKQKLLTRMAGIETLDRSRGMWVSILEDLSSRVPELLWLTDISDEKPKEVKANQRKPIKDRKKNKDKDEAEEKAAPKKQITNVEGYAYTLNSIASFFIGMMKSEYFDDVELAYAKQEKLDEVSAYKFKISCVVDQQSWLNENFQPEQTLTSPLAEN